MMLTARESEAGLVLIVALLVVAAAGVLFIVITLVIVIASSRPYERASDSTGPLSRDARISSTGEIVRDYRATDAAGEATLECVYLPGVSFPKTPALDHRVARRYLDVRQQMDEKGVRLTFTYGFRTTCQQREVNAGPNLKARPGTSPHEAGRAVDVSGMRVRPERGLIVQIFRANGFRWLGDADPPHFEVPAEELGEESRGGMIRRAQAAYQRGEPAGGCRGTECG